MDVDKNNWISNNDSSINNELHCLYIAFISSRFWFRKTNNTKNCINTFYGPFYKRVSYDSTWVGISFDYDSNLYSITTAMRVQPGPVYGAQLIQLPFSKWHVSRIVPHVTMKKSSMHPGELFKHTSLIIKKKV